MAHDSDTLSRARAAHARQEWPATATSYRACGESTLDADDLAAYADAAFWLGHMDDVLRLTAAAYDAFLAEERPADAGMSAAMLGIFHMSRGDEPQGTGWIGRAMRLADGAPESVVHGFLLFLTAVQPSLAKNNTTEAVTAARRLQDLGRRIQIPDLAAMGVHAEGQALLKAGHVADGMALIDEAMVSVLDGHIAPFNQWTLYCFTMEACHEVADVARMGRWTDLAEEWLATRPAAAALGPGFGGMCNVHRAQLHLLHGDWEDAASIALAAAQHDHVRIDYRAEAWYLVAESRRLRGTPDASAAYDEAHALGRNPQPGRALLRLALGDAEGAARTLRSALAAAGSDPLRRAPLCAAMTEAAVAAGRLEDAHTAATELQETAATWETSGLQAMAATARGAVLLGEGRPEEALAVLSEACRRWHDIGARYDAACACQRLADAYRAMGDEESAAAEAVLANTALEQLGAPLPELQAPDGLTGRECEVLALVADGKSNAEIGSALVISDRTVARHLTNIFHKIDVTSRTQAARYAIEHRLTR